MVNDNDKINWLWKTKKDVSVPKIYQERHRNDRTIKKTKERRTRNKQITQQEKANNK